MGSSSDGISSMLAPRTCAELGVRDVPGRAHELEDFSAGVAVGSGADTGEAPQGHGWEDVVLGLALSRVAAGAAGCTGLAVPPCDRLYEDTMSGIKIGRPGSHSL
jgi:hypothetical protein